MKTMKKNDDIVRISDDKQLEYVKKGYSYVPKSEWKKEVRGEVKQSTTTKKKKK